jgi:enoyl-CoA hydratase/carnithine racemase
MAGPITTTGTLTDGKTIVLDQALGTKPGPVRLTVEPLEPAPLRKPLREFLAELHKRQAVRGHVPRTREGIDRALQDERDSWGD